MSATLAPGRIALVHFRTLARNVPNSTPEVRMVKTFAAGILGASLLLAPIFAADDQAKKPRNDGMTQDMREAIAFEHFKDAAAARQARIEAKNPSVTNSNSTANRSAEDPNDHSKPVKDTGPAPKKDK